MKIDLNDLKAKMKSKDDAGLALHSNREEIAIIGMACKFASANNIAEFWEMLKNGTDCIRDYPPKRRDYGNEFLQNQTRYEGRDGYFEGGFLDQTDQFDHDFFGISPMEASLMSPDQRNFLQTALTAIEDAGYGGSQLRGSRTGVFLGHSSDFGVSYKEFIDALNPSMASFAISGNLNTIIASRLSYLLDLKGPSVNVDTACSSALAAIHTACRSLREGDCEIAVVGASKIDNLPLKSIKGKEDELGITSPDGRTRTFDHASQGTGLGEGIGVIILKSLSKAHIDGDHVYAVIKGSAMNQDGASANLTSPDANAQAAVIVKAWQNAKVHPLSISYIEAHGTGTKLGDPIEISGLTKAFRQYTDKTQFCAVGSVKSNIGHLDNAAGMAGIIKAALALEHKALPASIHFVSANDKIAFEESPVYVNASFQEWKSRYEKRRCGVSAFGLSGTNCHVVLEEEIADPETALSAEDEFKILTISARSKRGLLEYIWKYQKFLSSNQNINLNNLCFTANTGRGLYAYRIAILFKEYEELRVKLEEAYLYCMDYIVSDDIYYGENVSTSGNDFDLVLKTTKSPYDREDLTKLCQLYVKGGAAEWNYFYQHSSYKRVSLPTYPFEGIPLWVETAKQQKSTQTTVSFQPLHPLIHTCLADSFDTIVYSSALTTADYWLLNEHLIAKVPVIPGTAYIEMIFEAVQRHFAVVSLNISDLVFMAPLALEMGSKAEVHTVLKSLGDKLSFTIASKTLGADRWIIYTEGKVNLVPEEEAGELNLEEIKKRCYPEKLIEFSYEEGQGIELSDRWDCVREVYGNESEILAYLTIKKKYLREMEEYALHPALLDEAVNITLRTIGEGIYLPFSYKKLIVYNRLPEKLYSYVLTKQSGSLTKELASFDIILTDIDGNIIARAYDYTIKKIDLDHFIRDQKELLPAVYTMAWVEQQQQEIISLSEEPIVIVKGKGSICSSLEERIREYGTNIITIEPGNSADECISALEAVAGTLGLYRSCHIIYMLTLSLNEDQNTAVQTEEYSFRKLRENLSLGVYGFISLIRVLQKVLKEMKLRVTLLGEYANAAVSAQTTVIPENAALFGLGKALQDEYRQISCRCIDIDDDTDAAVIAREIFTKTSDYITAYRKNIRYISQLSEINQIEEKSLDMEGGAIKEDGIYLISGGTGGVGLLIAEYLSKLHANIILLNRSAFPCESEWNSILEANSSPKMTSKILRLKELVENGAKIQLYRVDVTDEEALHKTLDKIRGSYGRINGIFHAAGVAGDGFLAMRQDEAVRNVIAPKTEGTCLLDRLTIQDNMDFMVLFSSVSSILPEAGQCDYAAANSYLDSYAAYRNQCGRKTIVINWPAFSETGMALDYGVDFEKEVFKPISNQEAMKLLDWSIRGEEQRIVAGQLDYSNYMKVKGYGKLRLAGSIAAANANKLMVNGPGYVKNGQEKQVTLTGGDGDYTETQFILAQIMGNALGITSIDLSDGFLKLGGNSILAVKMEMDMEEQGLKVTLSDLYAHQSIRELAEYVDNSNRPLEKILQKPDAFNSEESEEVFILPDIEPFNTVLFKGCFHSALLSSLGFFGIEPIYVIMNDIIFYTDTKIEKGESLGILHSPIHTTKIVLERAGLFITERLKSDNIISDLKASLNLNKPVIIAIDCYYESISLDCYQKEHSPHSVLIYGYNEANEIFYMIEHASSKSIFYEKRELSYREVEDSYLGYLQNFKHLNIVESVEDVLVYNNERDCPTYFELERGNELVRVTTGDLQEDYFKGLWESRRMLKQSLEILCRYEEAFKRMVSDEAVFSAFCNTILDTCNAVINGQRIKQYQLQSFVLNQEIFHQQISEVVKNWEKIRNVIVKYSMTKSYRKNTGEGLKTKMDIIIDREREIYRKINLLLEEWHQRLD